MNYNKDLPPDIWQNISKQLELGYSLPISRVSRNSNLGFNRQYRKYYYDKDNSRIIEPFNEDDFDDGFFSAIKSCNYDLIKFYLESKGPIHLQFLEDLIESCTDMDIFKLFLENGYEMDNYTLYISIINNNIPITQYHLDKGFKFQQNDFQEIIGNNHCQEMFLFLLDYVNYDDDYNDFKTSEILKKTYEYFLKIRKYTVENKIFSHSISKIIRDTEIIYYKLVTLIENGFKYRNKFGQGNAEDFIIKIYREKDLDEKLLNLIKSLHTYMK